MTDRNLSMPAAQLRHSNTLSVLKGRTGWNTQIEGGDVIRVTGK